ncbi:putative rhomboid protease [Helianthus anomalus]
MKNLFTLKLISQNPRKFVSQTIRSNPLTVHRATNVTPHHHHHSFSHYTGYLQPFREAPTNCLMKVLSNPLVFKRVLPDGFFSFKASNKLFVDYGKFGSLRDQFRRHNIQFNQTVGYQKNWLSQFRRRLTTDGVIIGLIVTNVAVFLLWRVADRRFMMQNFMIQLDNFKSGRFHTMITSAFSHIEVGHIVSNMIGLYFFGKSIGYQFGPEFLLKLYLAGAFVGSVFFLVHHAFLAPSSKVYTCSYRIIFNLSVNTLNPNNTTRSDCHLLLPIPICFNNFVTYGTRSTYFCTVTILDIHRGGNFDP